ESLDKDGLTLFFNFNTIIFQTIITVRRVIRWWWRVGVRRWYCYGLLSVSPWGFVLMSLVYLVSHLLGSCFWLPMTSLKAKW
ncbi:unnamed protein product, partial [Brassica oleracea var. botrytis]